MYGPNANFIREDSLVGDGFPGIGAWLMWIPCGCRHRLAAE
ncbi:hypothetical protein HMPREF1619_03438 [Klebsiella pneumoniae 909957]|nr:hypothetical protein HMPREF1619_03438 [Klebsiella pneumoniae 909957]